MGKHLKVVPYDPRWPRGFEAERDRIAVALSVLALRIDRKGSTAVPGLAAKPIIDIQTSVEQLHPIESYAPSLAQLGYEHMLHPDDAFCPFFYRPSDWPHTHHAPVVQAGGDEERRTPGVSRLPARAQSTLTRIRGTQAPTCASVQRGRVLISPSLCGCKGRIHQSDHPARACTRLSARPMRRAV